MDERNDFDVQDFLPYLLNQAAEASSLAFQKIYKDRYGLFRAEWRVLFHLGLYGEMTAGEISRRAKIHKTKVSRAVGRLEERRFLTRKRDGDDRRLEHLALTETGRLAYRDLTQTAVKYDQALQGQFSAKEINLLRSMLKKLAEV